MHLKQIKRRIIKYSRYVKPTLIVGVFFLLILLFISGTSAIFKLLEHYHITSEIISSFITGKNIPLKKYQDRTNILILGIAGGKHDGPDLTDSIIYVSISFDKKEGVIISIPRDIWLDSLKDKINSAYHYGEEKKPGGGIILAKAGAEEIVGQPIHYAFIFDFSLFKKIIDLVGGVDVLIDEPFTDKLYPIAGKEDDLCGGDKSFSCRYETLEFKKGVEHMDGERALKYVRSRYAEGAEGTDFSRDSRQQQVMMAVKNKLLNINLYKDPNIINELIKTANGSVISDMDFGQKLIVFREIAFSKNFVFRRAVLDSGDNLKNKKGYLTVPETSEVYKSLWVLIPRTGDFDEIHKFISCQEDDPICKMSP